MITYLCYISYYDSETKNTVNISADITFTLVKNAENARLAYVTADTYVFKYDTNSALVGATQATLSAQVQGVTVSKWQYRNSAGNWADYPSTADNASITGGTLVVKPTHAVFFNSVAQIKLATTDSDVFDTVTISKLYDGAKGEQGQQGNPGSAGTGGLSVILGNEAQNIACSASGAVSSATDVTIPFTAYVGIAQTACSCSVGTLATGITVEIQHGVHRHNSRLRGPYLRRQFHAGRRVRADGNRAADLHRLWKKRHKELRLDKIQSRNQRDKRRGILRLRAQRDDCPEPVRDADACHLRIQRNDCHYRDIPVGEIHGRNVDEHQRRDRVHADRLRLRHCEYPVLPMHYDLWRQVLCGRDYRGGQIRPVCVGNALHRRVYREKQSGRAGSVCDQREVDALLGPISETAPSSPASGDFWYQVNHTAGTVTLMKYNGSAWASATETQSLSYTWYAQDKDGNAVTFGKTGKVIYLSAAEIDSILTLQCDVSN